MLNKQTLKKYVLQVNQTVRGLKVSGYILTLSTILVLIAYIHIPYNNSDVEGILGFTWMTSFLFALALPLTQISSGLIIKFMAEKIEGGYKLFFKGLSNLLLFTGFFFLIWTLAPNEIKEYFIDEYYYLMVVLLSIGLSKLSNYLHNAVIKFEKELQNNIRLLFTFIYTLDIKKHVKEQYQKMIAIDRIEVTDKVHGIEEK